MSASLRYMGGKRSLAPTIARLISDRHPNAAVADAFAGTCAIATALAPKHRIFANDVHAFATLIGRVLLNAPGSVPTLSQTMGDLLTNFNENLDNLSSALHLQLEQENKLLTLARTGRWWRDFVEFTEEVLIGGLPRSVDGLPSLAEYRSQLRNTPFALFSLYFAGGYFGFRQSVEIDSLRYAISCAPAQRQDYYLLALLQAISHCAATPGHFAQYLFPRDQKTAQYIARIRGRSVYRRFINNIAGMQIPACRDRESNVAVQAEATDFVSSYLSNEPDSELVIYADPPYSRAQYSRYYHVLETLVLYDYPETSGKGVYRGGRFNTDFSRSARVQQAMEEFVSVTADAGSSLYLSYPKNGLFYETGGDLLDLLGAYYSEASIASTTPLAHSTLGGAPGVANVKVLEDVYYAR